MANVGTSSANSSLTPRGQRTPGKNWPRLKVELLLAKTTFCDVKPLEVEKDKAFRHTGVRFKHGPVDFTLHHNNAPFVFSKCSLGHDVARRNKLPQILVVLFHDGRVP